MAPDTRLRRSDDIAGDLLLADWRSRREGRPGSAAWLAAGRDGGADARQRIAARGRRRQSRRLRDATWARTAKSTSGLWR